MARQKNRTRRRAKKPAPAPPAGGVEGAEQIPDHRRKASIGAALPSGARFACQSDFRPDGIRQVAENPPIRDPEPPTSCSHAEFGSRAR